SSALDVLGKNELMVLAGGVALIARLLGFGVEVIRLAAFIEVSEAPTTGCSVATAVLHHDRSQHAAPLPAVALFANEEFKHFFRDDRAVLVHTSLKALHRQFVRVEVKNTIGARFDARGFGETSGSGRNKRAVEESPRTVAVRIGDGSVVGTQRRSL